MCVDIWYEIVRIICTDDPRTAARLAATCKQFRQMHREITDKMYIKRCKDDIIKSISAFPENFYRLDFGIRDGPWLKELVHEQGDVLTRIYEDFQPVENGIYKQMQNIHNIHEYLHKNPHNIAWIWLLNQVVRHKNKSYWITRGRIPFDHFEHWLKEVNKK